VAAITNSNQSERNVFELMRTRERYREKEIEEGAGYQKSLDPEPSPAS